jgi:hypothetical protein
MRVSKLIKSISFQGKEWENEIVKKTKEASIVKQIIIKVVLIKRYKN